MQFEWDEEKNKINKEKHHLAFEDAVYVFNDPFFNDPYRIVKFTLENKDVPSQETLNRINAGYAVAERFPFYDEENPPLTHSELATIASQVKLRA